MAKTLITSQGLALIKICLQELQQVKLPEIIDQIRVAREHGDLRENAEYCSACNSKKLIEKSIYNYQQIIQRSEPMRFNIAYSQDHVTFGTSVTLSYSSPDKEEIFKTNIVSQEEIGFFKASHAREFTSISSPFAQSILGKKVGDRISYNEGHLTILEVNALTK